MGKLKATEFKTHLSMAKIRLQQKTMKKNNVNRASRREVAQMITSGNTTRAEIKAEMMVREDYTVEAYEILLDLLELIIARSPIIMKEKTCPPSLLMHISTVIWAASYVEVPDFMTLKEDFKKKYGKRFVEEALANTLNKANPKIVARLSIMVPPRDTVLRYMEGIAKQFDVGFDPRSANPDILVPGTELGAPQPGYSSVVVSAPGAMPPGAPIQPMPHMQPHMQPPQPPQPHMQPPQQPQFPPMPHVPPQPPGPPQGAPGDIPDFPHMPFEASDSDSKGSGDDFDDITRRLGNL
eukprot:gnl/Chilomastix_cuspidata/299.p1 GENE.gnl/Chilomastix_cuspidata/299~~gnl/Chilomastix_cuspidata/299.p1  ORF type:complete len:306 (-),score=123.31 gnl/Chilomastix_cuspidata/299:60-944(-)